MTEQQEKDLVVVIDDIMGGGKSTNTISGLRDMHNSGWLKDNPVVLITPFKDEVERFQQALGDVNFVSPTDEDDALYLEQFKEMAREGKHIITTHALYRLFDAEARDILRNNKYGLVMDEAVDVLEPVDIFDADIKFFLGTDVIKVEEERVSNGRTLQRVWKGSEEAPSKYRKDFSYFDSREHYLVDEFYGLDRDPKYHIIKALPRNLIEVFHGITILTYRFEHSLLRCILDLWERPYHMISATGEYRETDTSELRELITVEDNVKWNYWYQGIKSVKTKPKYHNRSTPSVLSSTWCKKNVSGAAGLEGLSKVVRNFYDKHCESGKEGFGWTAYKDYRKRMFDSCKRYDEKDLRNFIPCNARATNKYQHKNAMAYCCNFNIQPALRFFMNEAGIRFDADQYALSSFLQWLWRSRIRQGKPVTVFIPAPRIRSLFLQWLGYSVDEIEDKWKTRYIPLN